MQTDTVALVSAILSCAIWAVSNFAVNMTHYGPLPRLIHYKLLG